MDPFHSLSQLVAQVGSGDTSNGNRRHRVRETCNSMQFLLQKWLLRPFFTSFNRTKGGLIQLNHGRPQPLQFVVNAAFLATLFSDYLEAADTPGWYCGPNFYSTDVLRKFAETQVYDCLLFSNFHKKMSYLVGYGNHYPLRYIPFTYSLTT
ncbi:hypothetical protein LIER_00024 [Lithospermum erythrorhizon]|uniref:cellulase n=1 Tax=Lithospermum erythrorhizon TaxID=34254 RepID=A0AAV3NH93_LITER